MIIEVGNKGHIKLFKVVHSFGQNLFRMHCLKIPNIIKTLKTTKILQKINGSHSSRV